MNALRSAVTEIVNAEVMIEPGTQQYTKMRGKVQTPSPLLLLLKRSLNKFFQLLNVHVGDNG